MATVSLPSRTSYHAIPHRATTSLLLSVLSDTGNPGRGSSPPVQTHGPPLLHRALRFSPPRPLSVFRLCNGFWILGKINPWIRGAVKKILNNLGQVEKEFRVEVEAIGHVRHQNIVRLLGYCIKGVHRLLVYEYVNNGNLEQWLHGAMSQKGILTWEARMKVINGIAKA
ncbi:probable receptor-like protein kinase At2g42960 [Vigna angularis]|uniref:probable receptor-like protein kinase At2g42960 n=1 Tax=Phaseolus angularis TaxID=3914 RepID=UPI0022B345AD|nr:probable receptor-like protein kinase At2g42960 [Vigna angularis]